MPNKSLNLELEQQSHNVLIKDSWVRRQLAPLAIAALEHIRPHASSFLSNKLQMCQVQPVPTSLPRRHYAIHRFQYLHTGTESALRVRKETGYLHSDVPHRWLANRPYMATAA
ncbi:hypothetical protein GQ43DRAFT_491730 [Delitschia confertaspora ATCC 74209]|uniref:Uncharacterized protein n=1 Tax=Delitschia confertaspora ATCC 74209 TaxID=1513339 RepID=A0A9P4JJE7_9PLEO|nr:hypothetical protein GQ43DRAFT_491730 [Delitschia confertaspora ATCC 74209]